MTDYLSLKPYKAQFLQKLYEEDFLSIIIFLTDELEEMMLFDWLHVHQT